jgi:hypothetical protein
MHLRDSVDTMLDPEGQEFESIEALRDAVLLNVRSLMAADIADGILDLRFRIEAEDENGKVVYRLPFKHAINIIPEEAWDAGTSSPSSYVPPMTRDESASFLISGSQALPALVTDPSGLSPER